MIRRLKRAWAAFMGNDEIEQRGISFASAALEHLEHSEQWNIDTCRLIAHEAVLRKLAGATLAEGYFARTVDGILLSHAAPSPKTHRI